MCLSKKNTFVRDSPEKPFFGVFQAVDDLLNPPLPPDILSPPDIGSDGDVFVEKRILSSMIRLKNHSLEFFQAVDDLLNPPLPPDIPSPPDIGSDGDVFVEKGYFRP